ncbi:hypothetical protein ElP_01220 [Tautonia plasticadhaerens]|uniref:Uncharacterized protein n=1 Tax=Tautonia plasticadhaerens TaxID=2527974 RepID=A0A518GUP3_9BACT|nr:hypothetical protein ElP_01220 [Tautonia plasticadhaerens]
MTPVGNPSPANHFGEPDVSRRRPPPIRPAGRLPPPVIGILGWLRSLCEIGRLSGLDIRRGRFSKPLNPRMGDW